MQEVFEKIIDELEKLADELYKSYCIGFNSDDRAEYDAYINAIEIVKQESEQYNGGWIPCSEQLPEPIRPVLVTLKNWMNDKCFVRVGRFHTDHWKTDEGIVENSVVLAWKPLPTPYQPKGE